ncbi:pyroglutamyl-peptidase 1 isoform X2 [Chaetodon auriga]|uniref:pyroglutamyl-peptidase 1 isoform X2 n=1 Tax=Chaetodon auriga TaxID=39042 RepID=UPI004032BC58
MEGRETVVVTGFGPFRQFLVNPSWTAAQGLKVFGLGEQIDVYIKEFAVHLGLARGSSVVILEQTGKNSGYRDRDVCGFCPESHCCLEGGPEKLDSVINMRAVSKEFRQAGVDVIYSRDAGRYLCDFAYYCSLCHGGRRAALIHVPSSGSLSSADRLVPLLQTLIRTMLDQLEDPSDSQSQ